MSAPKASIRVGGNFFLGNYSDASNQNIQNGTLLGFVSIIKHVVSSAAEVEMGALFISMKEAEVMITTLEEIGSQRRSKAMDRRFYWCQDRVSENILCVYWNS